MDRDAVERGAGVVSVVVSLGATLLATLVSPTFSWSDHALSNLGVTWTEPGTSTTLILFDGGLVLGGVLGLGFAHYLFRHARSVLARIASVLLGFTLVAMAAIGVFPQGHSLHAPVAVGFFLLLSLALVTAGVAAYRLGDRTWALASLVLGGFNLVAWMAWGALGPVRREGLAIPEIAGSVAFAFWVLLAVWRSGSG